MKIIYLITYAVYGDSIGIHSGVRNKLDAQISGLKNHGLDVQEQTLPLQVTSPISFIQSGFNGYKTLRKLYSSLDSGDVVYIRSLTPYITNFVLSFMKKDVNNVYEIQNKGRYANNIFKQSLLKTIQLFYLNTTDRFFAPRIIRKSSAIVSVTHEIANHYLKRAKTPVESLILGNGINMSLYHQRIVPKFSDSIDVLIVAYVCPWHGVDRLIRGLHEYESTPDKRNIVLHIVGDGPELPYLKELTAELNLQNRVIFHGFKSGKELDEMFDMCHIAIGSLAGFRVGLTELSSLKSREYCARGIPFLMASKDADFPEGFNWVQMVPAEENPIDMNTVVDFANRVMSDPEHPQKMRKYAEENLDWMAKMRVLKEFLETL